MALSAAPSSPSDGVLIVGAGLASLFLALKLNPRPVIVLSPAPLGEAAASAWAQGGLAAALADDDSPLLHAEDTIVAGGPLVDPVVAHLVAEHGPARVRDLIEIGVPFDRAADGRLLQSLEAAHSRARVARVSGDRAGKAIMDALAKAALAAPHIRLIEGLSACALLRDANGAAAGVLARDAAGALHRLAAAETVLAAGGVGGLWRVTTNPPTALGEGLAMAARIGALIADPEFMQFHPTAIDVGRDPAPLATEALRGEGALLVDRAGAPFMAAYDPRAELAPRDIVARAIHRQLAAGGGGAFLDARAAVGAHFPDAFPTVFAACMAAGIDPRTAPIPVAPAAHYHMGGVASDLWGRSSVARLSVVGECASTGVHGANRLASNSLLEAVVFAARIAERLGGEAPAPAPAPLEAEAPLKLSETQRSALRDVMADQCGVERDGAGLEKARDAIAALAAQSPGAAPNALTAAAFVVEGALRRASSLGAHQRTDFPDLALSPARTFLTQSDIGWLSPAKAEAA